MLHVIPILCLIAFIFIVEMQIKKQVDVLKKELEELYGLIKQNKINISKNTESIKINTKSIQSITNDSSATDNTLRMS